GQPREQGAVGGEAPGQPLVEVVVGVDQTGGGQAATPVDDPRALDRGGRAGADGADPTVGHHDVPARVLGARGVDGGDRGAVDDDGAHQQKPGTVDQAG